MKCTNGVRWSSHVSRDCIMMFFLQCQCRCYDGPWMWGAASGCAGCAVRLCMRATGEQ